jgi:glycosyltransferase involved in cell wall biosynthesis
MTRVADVRNEPVLGTSDGNGGHSEPLVSVIIPAFQCAQYIAEAIQSVRSQSYSKFEIIVVNDGSPDTPQLEQALVPYIESIRYQKQSTTGPAGARNNGIRQARGSYIAFLDSDDYWSPEHLSRQVSLFRLNPDLDLVYCDYMLLKSDRPFARAFDMQPQSPIANFESLLVEDCAIGTSTAVCSRERIIKAGLFDEQLLRCEDFEMWLRMAVCGAQIAYNSDVQVYHRINEAGLSADKWSMKRDRIRVYQKVASTFSISERQQGIVRELIARTEADCHVDELKHALEKGDYATAVTAARKASAAKANWKLKASLLGLKVMPSLFRLLHLVRSFLQRNAQKSTKPIAPQKARNGNSVESEDAVLVGGSGAVKR